MNEKHVKEFQGLLLSQGKEDPIDWVKDILDKGMDVIDFFNEVFTPALTGVGEKFSRLEIYLPELIDVAEVAKRISDQVVQPLISEQSSDLDMKKGKIMMCTVQGDLHDIGKNMVVLMLQVNGFEVIDLGINVPVNEILDRVKEHKPDIVGLSALMTTSQPYMKEVVERRDGMGLKEEFFIIVGGAPITEEYADTIGADAFGKDAVDAVKVCKNLLSR